MKVSLSNPVSNSNVRAAAHGLWEANLLGEYNVSLAVFPGSILDRLGGVERFSEIRRRLFDPELKPYIKTWPWLEIGRQVATKAGFSSLINNETDIFNNNSVNINMDKHVASGLNRAAKKGVKAVYCFEDVASFSFRKAKSLGLKCLYELPIGYWRTMHRLLNSEKERWPEWAITLTGFMDSEAKLLRKDDELRLADRIYVASSFTAHTLQEFPGTLAPIEVIPYGFPSVDKGSRNYSVRGTNKPLKLLFVGGLSQRKGIADLFEAVEGFGAKIALTVVGQKTGYCLPLDRALAKHHWIPSLPHSSILELMRENDVLVFPSLFEGFGLVITEAMSQGMPVITTDRTAGPDFINHGQNGWLIEAGSIPQLRQAIEELLYNPGLIMNAGKEAMETARLRPWKMYGQELAESVNKLC